MFYSANKTEQTTCGKPGTYFNLTRAFYDKLQLM